MSNSYIVLWDFDGTLGYRPGMWGQALLDVLREHRPNCAVTLEEVRPFLRAGSPGISLRFPMWR